MEIGQVPRVVLLPIFQDQLTAPVELAVLSPSPAAVDGPDLYSTSIEQRALAVVLIDTEAVLFRGADAVSALTLTDSFVEVGVGVDFDFGFAVGFDVAPGFAVVTALVVDVEAAETVGAAVTSSGLAWPTSPKAAGGAVGTGSAVLPPRRIRPQRPGSRRRSGCRSTSVDSSPCGPRTLERAWSRS